MQKNGVKLNLPECNDDQEIFFEAKTDLVTPLNLHLLSVMFSRDRMQLLVLWNDLNTRRYCTETSAGTEVWLLSLITLVSIRKFLLFMWFDLLKILLLFYRHLIYWSNEILLFKTIMFIPFLHFFLQQKTDCIFNVQQKKERWTRNNRS